MRDAYFKWLTGGLGCYASPMASPVTVTFNPVALRAFAVAMGRMGRGAFDRSQRKAVTFIAKDYRKFKRDRIERDIDRPSRFTKIGYDFDGAPRSGPIVSRTFVRDKQSRYLDIVETGGIRRSTGNNGPIGIKPGFEDRFGGMFGARGMRKRYLSRSATPTGVGANGRPTYKTGARRYVIMKLRDRRTGEELEGVFEKRKMGKKTTKQRRGKGKSSWRTRLIISFKDSATYRPQLGFGRDAHTYARSRFPNMAKRLFEEELRKAMSR